MKTDPIDTYREAGYQLMPLHHWQATRTTADGRVTKLGKAPYYPDWTTVTLTDFDPRAHLARGGNVGVRLAPEDLVIDVDPRHFRDGDEPLIRLLADFAIPADTPTVITGSGGLHLYLKFDGSHRVVDTLDEYPGVEFKSRGRQVVAAGSRHPDTGALYEFDVTSAPLTSRREAPAALLRVIRRADVTHAESAPRRVTIEQLASMLEVLDPTEFRDHARWRDLMMACHDATEGAGRDEFVRWSVSDPQYEDHAWLVGRQWDTVRRETGSARITFRTLFKLVSEAGHADRLPRPSAEDDFDGSDGEVDPASAAARDERSPLERMNERYVAVVYGGKFRVFYRELDPSVPPAGRKYWERLDATNFGLLLRNQRVETGDGSSRSIADAWLQWPRRRTAHGVVFDPTKTYDGWLNLWTGWGVEPRRGDWSILRDVVMRETLCAGDPEAFRYVLCWCAKMVQDPKSTDSRTSLNFYGAPGTGKGSLGRALVAMCGSHGQQLTRAEHLLGRFNAHMRDLLFVFADEAVTPYDRAAISAMKNLVTETQGLTEAKGVDATWGLNLTHIMSAANESWIVNADIDDRRYAVFEVDPTKRPRSFWIRFNELIYERGGLAAMLYDLLSMDISGFDRGAIPTTTARTSQVLRSLPPVQAWWYQRLRDGEITDALGDWSRGPVKWFREDARKDFARWCETASIRPGASGRALDMVFAADFKRTCREAEWDSKTKVPDGRPDVRAHGDGRAWCITLPPLGRCRALFVECMGTGTSVSWSDGGMDEDDVLR